MKKKIVSLGLAACLLLSACGANSGSGKNGSIAKVNDQFISSKDYDKLYTVYAKFYANSMGLNNQVKEMMIQDILIQEDLKKNKIEVTDQDKKAIFDENLTRIGGKENYDAFLKANNITDEEYKSTIYSNAYYKKHQDWFNENHPVVDADLEKYYQENKASIDKFDVSHILVKTEDEAKKVKERLEKGEDFAKLAKEVSTDAASAANGGNLGLTNLSKFVPELQKAARTLKEGKISDPVKSQFGYHIIKLNSKTEGLDANKDTVVQALNQQKYSDYLKSLREQAKVEDFTNVQKPNVIDKENKAEDSGNDKENTENESKKDN